jgi:hypothetical protein
MAVSQFGKCLQAAALSGLVVGCQEQQRPDDYVAELPKEGIALKLRAWGTQGASVSIYSAEGAVLNPAIATSSLSIGYTEPDPVRPGFGMFHVLYVTNFTSGQSAPMADIALGPVPSHAFVVQVINLGPSGDVVSNNSATFSLEAAPWHGGLSMPAGESSPSKTRSKPF